MKRPPKKGEPALVHKTVNTGHEQSIAICKENYKRNGLEATRIMLHEAVLGYRVAAVRPKNEDDIIFFVVRDEDGEQLTENRVRWRGEDVLLDTTILSGDMTPDEAYMLSDLEQCAALMLIAEVYKEPIQ